MMSIIFETLQFLVAVIQTVLMARQTKQNDRQAGSVNNGNDEKCLAKLPIIDKSAKTSYQRNDLMRKSSPSKHLRTVGVISVLFALSGLAAFIFLSPADEPLTVRTASGIGMALFKRQYWV